jgi:hypothetical protein
MSHISVESYKTIKDQLVSLAVDVEDKQKVSQALHRKVESERNLLSSVEDEIAAKYQVIIEVRRVKWKRANV